MTTGPASRGVPSLFGVPPKVVDRLAKHYAEVGTSLTYRQVSALFRLELDTINNIYSDPAFIALVGMHAEKAMHRDGKPAAIRVLIDIAKDARQAPQHRIRAAELILSRTVAPAAPAPVDTGRDLAELSTNELRALVDSMQQQLAERAVPVDAPDTAPKQIEGEAISADSVFD